MKKQKHLSLFATVGAIQSNVRNGGLGAGRENQDMALMIDNGETTWPIHKMCDGQRTRA